MDQPSAARGRGKDVVFTVAGTAPPVAGAARGAAVPAAPGGAIVKASVRLGTQRTAGPPQTHVATPGEDVVVLSVANGPRLVLHPENARELLLAQGTTPAAAAGGGARSRAAPAAVEVPVQLGWPGLEAAAPARGAGRGWLGSATLAQFDILTGWAQDQAADLATAAATRALDGAVEEGVYRLVPDALPPSLKKSGQPPNQVEPAPDGGPLLVLVHGTFVDTVSTFGQLWQQHPQAVQALFQAYGGRVYAFDHPTLRRSPIGNALALAQALPEGARLHLLTHSRGGLVAEVLARACAHALRQEELALFPGPDYAVHRKELQQLVEVARGKGLQVERLVRVACPAHGTLLASRRLDAYLSVLQWGLQLAGVPVLPQIVDFLHEVARRRARPRDLPGLEAMVPDSPLVRWLTRQEQPIPGELRVVAGDIQGDSVVSWVKTLLADAYYWTDNDLVVHTRGMYGGVPRAPAAGGAAARFVLDRGARVSHFNYFANASSVQAIVQGLTQAQPAGYAPIGPLSWKGEEAGGQRAAAAVRRSRGAGDADRANRPAVVVLPGILGSHLKLDGDRVWLGWSFLNGLEKLAWDPVTTHRVEPDAPFESTYSDLMERLADTHEVIPFPYDWRRPIEDEARRLAGVVEGALALREASGRPVRLLAHSMGGLVARALQLEAPQTWRRLMAREGARVVMLGTPHGGSWAPMQVLTGDDDFGNALAAFGSLLDNAKARKVMAGMPGFLQLQAGLLQPQLGLDRSETWRKLAEEDLRILLQYNSWHDFEAQKAVYHWSAPPQDVLDAAVRLRRRLDAQLDELAADAPRICIVVGQARFTPDGYELGPHGLEYLAAVDGGDGRVTLQNTLLPGVRAWKVREVHGSLPARADAFAGYLDLLEYGDTQRLAPLQRDARGAAVPGAPQALHGRLRPSRRPWTWRPPASPAQLFDAPQDDPAAQEAASGPGRLQLRVVNGDLQFVRGPLLIGHYVSLRLTGAEAVVDRMVGLAMSRAMEAGLYPDRPGTHQVFPNERPLPGNALEPARPSAAVVVGLGEEGKLTSGELAASVRQGILAYAQRLAERAGGAPVQFELAATLVGSGGSGITVTQAAQCVAHGARDALRRIAAINAAAPGRRWPELARLDLVELYLDRATEAWNALRQLEQAEGGAFALEAELHGAPGALRRTLDGGYRGASYDVVSVLSVPGRQGERCLEFRLDTRRARTEVTGLRAQARLLDRLVQQASGEPGADPQVGRTLFQLLVPVEIEPYLAGRDEVVVELDDATASLPWELLDTDGGRGAASAAPWAVRTRVIRKLRVAQLPPPRRDALADDAVLVVGEPDCDPARFPPLEGARREAMAVRDLLAARLAPGQVRALVDRDRADAILKTLFERPYRIVHIAGHGAEGRPDEPGGVVLSDGVFLGATEVAAMRTVPELVFLNCCHLAAWKPGQDEGRHDRARFAANIARALIQAGVRCVVAAGWAVDDHAAQVFATAFYAALLSGRRFIEAVGQAREAAWAARRGDVTWAAYQCYGDPEWRWRDGTADAQAPQTDLHAAVPSPMQLCLVLDTLASDTAHGRKAPAAALRQLQELDLRFGARWGHLGVVAEAYGVAFAQAQAVEPGIGWYTRAVQAADGTASFRAAEQLARLQARRGHERADPALVHAAIERLESLLQLQATGERHALLAAAWQQLSWTPGTSPEQSQEALAAAIEQWREAESRFTGSAAVHEAALAALACEFRSALLGSGGRRRHLLDAARVQQVRAALAQADRDAPAFGTAAGLVELQVLEAAARRRLAPQMPQLLPRLQDLQARVPSAALWQPVQERMQFALQPYAQGRGLPAAERKAAREWLAAVGQAPQA